MMIFGIKLENLYEESYKVDTKVRYSASAKLCRCDIMPLGSNSPYLFACWSGRLAKKLTLRSNRLRRISGTESRIVGE